MRTGIGRVWYRLGGILALAGLLAAVAALGVQAAAERFFPVDQVRPGMRGEGRTVVQGTKIERFGVEILGVLKNAGPSGDLVLVRVDGDAMERAGGIAAGMSGSPVYVDGKLLGAIGYGFNFADHKLGLVTPIGDMVAVFDQGGEGRARTALGSAPVQVGEKTFRPVAVPLLAGGLSTRARERLAAALKPYGVVPVQAGGGDGPPEATASFEPGSAIGVQLVRGDIDLTAIGTVTFVDEDGRFVAFGHPFMNFGGVDFFATTAYIYRTVQSVEAPFKIGAPLELVGRIGQDRGAAIGGSLGQMPDAVALQVKVTDEDRYRQRVFRMEVARDDLLTTVLSVIASLSALDKGIDRLGPGTSTVRFEIDGEGMPEKLVRLNLWYSPVDISALSLLEFLEGVDKIILNPFQEARVNSIKLSATISRERRTATIEEAKADRERVRPGERVLLEVRIRPFRGEQETKVLALDLPEDLEPGPLSVTVRGGEYRFPFDEQLSPILSPVQPGGEEGKDKQKEPASPQTPAENLSQFIEEFASRERNNEVVAEFYPGAPQDEQSPPAEGPVYQDVEPVQARLVTPYVIEGYTTVDLEVESGEPQGGAAGPSPGR